jgi:hypothetical protein
MSTVPTPRPAEDSRTRQRRYLIGGAVVIALLIAANALLDSRGAARDENEGRSNETHERDSPVPATTSVK